MVAETANHVDRETNRITHGIPQRANTGTMNLPVNGNSFISACTTASEYFLPIKRFTSNIVLTGFDDAWDVEHNQRGQRGIL